MRAISFLIAGLVTPCFAQTGVIAQGSVNRLSFSFYWQSRLEPPSPPLADDLGYSAGYNSADDSIYRVMLDRAHRTYFGYQVHVVPIPQNMYRLTFHPLNLTLDNFKQLHMEEPEKWNKWDIGAPASRPLFQPPVLYLQPLAPGYPFREAPDRVHELDVVAVDLLVNQTSRQKIVDYVVIQGPSRSWTWNQLNTVREFSYPGGEPRDFALQDAGLRFVEPQVSFNGKVWQVPVPGEVSGAYVWLAAPNRGAYVLTLAPHPEGGFQKAGEVRGTSLRFTLGADTVVVTSSKPIVSSDAAFNLYVRLDPAWQADVFGMMGAAKWSDGKR
ncbi:MAG TPA: hypothetical protein VIY49_22435 [Bryobacteraceae bacterium]